DEDKEGEDQGEEDGGVREVMQAAQTRAMVMVEGEGEDQGEDQGEEDEEVQEAMQPPQTKVPKEEAVQHKVRA
ncbi:hypothetical protein CHU98_g12023, partial [Xylaria longipes]